jgi:hypothetical protein
LLERVQRLTRRLPSLQASATQHVRSLALRWEIPDRQATFLGRLQVKAARQVERLKYKALEVICLLVGVLVTKLERLKVVEKVLARLQQLVAFVARNQRPSAHDGLIDRLTAQVGDRGLAINILRKRGHIEPHSEQLTTEGRDRDNLGAEGRAKDRAVKAGGGAPLDYVYDYDTNRTRKK